MNATAITPVPDFDSRFAALLGAAGTTQGLGPCVVRRSRPEPPGAVEDPGPNRRSAVIARHDAGRLRQDIRRTSAPNTRRRWSRCLERLPS